MTHTYYTIRVSVYCRVIGGGWGGGGYRNDPDKHKGESPTLLAPNVFTLLNQTQGQSFTVSVLIFESPQTGVLSTRSLHPVSEVGTQLISISLFFTLI